MFPPPASLSWIKRLNPVECFKVDTSCAVTDGGSASDHLSFIYATRSPVQITVIRLHVKVQLLGVCRPCVFPSVIAETNVDRKKEHLEWLSHIWFCCLAHTHTPETAHASETRASHVSPVVLAECDILLLETTNAALVREFIRPRRPPANDPKPKPLTSKRPASRLLEPQRRCTAEGCTCSCVITFLTASHSEIMNKISEHLAESRGSVIDIDLLSSPS